VGSELFHADGRTDMTQLSLFAILKACRKTRECCAGKQIVFSQLNPSYTTLFYTLNIKNIVYHVLTLHNKYIPQYTGDARKF
jgi:hypothetical protein